MLFAEHPGEHVGEVEARVALEHRASKLGIELVDPSTDDVHACACVNEMGFDAEERRNVDAYVKAHGVGDAFPSSPLHALRLEKVERLFGAIVREAGELLSSPRERDVVEQRCSSERLLVPRSNRRAGPAACPRRTCARRGPPAQADRATPRARGRPSRRVCRQEARFPERELEVVGPEPGKGRTSATSAVRCPAPTAASRSKPVRCPFVARAQARLPKCMAPQ